MPRRKPSKARDLIPEISNFDTVDGLVGELLDHEPVDLTFEYRHGKLDRLRAFFPDGSKLTYRGDQNEWEAAP